jgi:hypothetical protein
MPAFQYRLILRDGTPADPPKFETATPQWREGDTFLTRPGRTFRILAITDSGDDFTGSGPLALPLRARITRAFESRKRSRLKRTPVRRARAGKRLSRPHNRERALSSRM